MVGLSSTDGYSYSYDANGNLRTKTKSAPLVTKYLYDFENRLAGVNQTFKSDYVTSSCGTGVDCTANADPRGLVPKIQSGLTLSLRAVGSVVSTSGSNTITWYYVDNGTAVQMGSPYACSQSCSFDVTRTANARLTNWDSLYGKITFTENGNTYVTTTILTLTYAPGMLGNTKYGYSSDGLRTSVNATGAAAVNYGYDPIGLGSPPEPTGEFSSGQLKNQTLYDAGNGAPLERTVQGVAYNVHRDGEGRVTSITNATQGLQSSYRYESFGAQTQAAGPVQSPYRYTSREWDSSDGLQYSRARYYDPATGRFLSKDPAGAVQETNRYAYVGNNPLVRSDPSGLRYEKDGGGGGGAPPPPSSPVPPSPGAPPKWQSIGCLVNDTAFIIGVILSLLGLPSDVSAEEAVVLQIVNLVGVDFILGAVGMLVGGTDVLSGIVAITQLIFDFAQIVLQDLLPRMIQGFFMWLAVTTNFALTFVPGELGVKLILMAYSIGLGLEGIAAGGCL